MENIGLPLGSSSGSANFLNIYASTSLGNGHGKKLFSPHNSINVQKTTRVLYLEDSKNDADLLEITLNQSGNYHCTIIRSLKELKLELNNTFDILISEYQLKGPAIDHVIKSVKNHKPQIPIVILSSKIPGNEIDKVIRCGAADVILKENIRRLPIVIDRVIKDNETRLALENYKEEADTNNALLDTMFDGFEDIIVLKDAGLKYLKANGSALKSLNVAESNLIGKKRSDLFADKLTKEDEEEDRRVLTESGPLRFQREVISEKGIRQFWDTIKTPIKYNGVITGIASISRDITTEKLAEEESRKCEAILALAEELVNSGSFQYDLDRDIIQGTPNFMRLLGMKSGQNKVSLSRFIRHIFEEDRPSFVRDLELALENRTPLQIRNRIQPPGYDEPQWFITKMVPDQDSCDQTKFIGTVVEESSVQIR